MQNRTRTRRPKTAEQRERSNAYIRRYRREHPDAVRRWRENAILAAAARITAARAQEHQDDDGGRDDGDML